LVRGGKLKKQSDAAVNSEMRRPASRDFGR
jgi:hypothetical protein